MTEPLVRVVRLRREYGSGGATVAAVRDATFEIGTGDRVALVGPSGSGKSTLLHLVAALDRPTAGTIEWPALGPPEGLRPDLVRMAFQGPSLLPPLTVAENVALPLLLGGWDEGAARQETAPHLDRLLLSDVASKLPEQLSGGQLQRAAVARALVGEPKLVLVDEPTGQQDRAGGAMVLDAILDRVGEIDASLVVATHDPAIAERLAVRWSMRDGRLDREVVLRSG